MPIKAVMQVDIAMDEIFSNTAQYSRVTEVTVGGLGIYMVKKLMSSVSYEYRDGLNILMITKNTI